MAARSRLPKDSICQIAARIEIWAPDGSSQGEAEAKAKWQTFRHTITRRGPVLPLILEELEGLCDSFHGDKTGF